MEFLFDSRNVVFKTPFGCLPHGETLEIHCFVKDAGETGVLFLIEEDGKESDTFPMSLKGEKKGYRHYALSIPTLAVGLYFYRFRLLTEQQPIDLYRDEMNHPVARIGQTWQLTCYRRHYPIPETFQGTVMYQIFPDRFNRAGTCDTSEKLTPFFLHEAAYETPVFEPDEQGRILNNDFFGGNLQGIIDKLPYLSALGIKLLYLNPIFKAFSNHRYDTADYLQVDPLLGTNDDFARLCREAHHYGMSIMLDGVFSHIGSDSLYFDKQNRFGNGAYHNPASPYRSWFQFTDYPHGYHSWWGIDTLPCTEENDLSFRRFILFGESSVIRFWFRLGADAWRLDVADELPDSFLAQLYHVAKEEKPDSLILGEVWEDASNKISYGVRRKYFLGEGLDAVMNYVWRDAIIRFTRKECSAEDLMEAIMSLCEHYPQDTLNATMISLSTHDTPRILTILGVDHEPESRKERAGFRLTDSERKNAIEKLKMALFFQFSLPGSPCLYYGDEIGMEGFEDPFNRAYMGDRPACPEIFSFLSALALLKNTVSALRFGAFEPVTCSQNIFAFYRLHENERILCLVNNSDTPYKVQESGKILFAENLWPEKSLLFPRGTVMIQVSACHKTDADCIK